MKHNAWLRIAICIILLFFFVSTATAREERGKGKRKVSPSRVRDRDPGDHSDMAPKVHQQMNNNPTPNAMASFERDAQQSVEPDAIPTVPAGIQTKNKKEVSRNRDTRNWYEDMESCAIDY